MFLELFFLSVSPLISRSPLNSICVSSFFHSIWVFNNFLSGWPWGWSSGQGARLLLWRSEFESRWRLHYFSVKFVFEKNWNKQREAGVAHLFKSHWRQRLFVSACGFRYLKKFSELYSRVRCHKQIFVKLRYPEIKHLSHDYCYPIIGHYFNVA